MENEIPEKLDKEITFNGTCGVCGRKNVECLMHHLIPRRLLNIIPKNRARKFEHQKIIICIKCNNYFHVENKLYRRINLLERIIAFEKVNIQKTLQKMEGVEGDVQQ